MNNSMKEIGATEVIDATDGMLSETQIVVEKKKMSTKELLDQARKGKTQQTNNRFIKKSGSKRDKDECRRVNFNR